MLYSFFLELPKKDQLDKETVSAIIDLYNDGKLSDKNLSNALGQLREAELDDKD